MATEEEERLKRLLRTLNALATRVPTIKLRRIEEKFPLLQLCTGLKLQISKKDKKHSNETYIVKAGILLLNEGKKFICYVCHAQLSSYKYMSEHQRLHTGEKPYECKKCNKKFCFGSNYIVHQRACMESGTNTVDKTFTDLEPIKIESDSQLKKLEEKVKQRNKTITGSPSTQCTKCNKYFHNRGNLFRHIKANVCKKVSAQRNNENVTHVKNLEPKVKKRNETITGTENTYCANCNTYFHKRYTLIRHLMTKVCLKKRKQTEHRCEYCNRVCLSSGALSTHVRSCKPKIITKKENVPPNFPMKEASDDANQLQNKNIVFDVENIDICTNQVSGTSDKEINHLMDTGNNKSQTSDSGEIMQPTETMKFRDCTEPQMLNVTSDSDDIKQQSNSGTF